MNNEYNVNFLSKNEVLLAFKTHSNAFYKGWRPSKTFLFHHVKILSSNVCNIFDVLKILPPNFLLKKQRKKSPRATMMSM